MLQIDIRRGIAEDAMLVADLTRNMVVEVTPYSGRSVNTSPETWSSVAERDFAVKRTPGRSWI